MKLFRVFSKLRSLPLESYYTLSGWRFGDLKAYLDQSIGREADAALAIAESVIICGPARAKVALISCLPPDKTGIANFTLQHASALEIAADVFSPVRDVPQFLRQRAALQNRSGGRVHLHPLSALPARDEISAYSAILAAVGNSDHNVDVLQQVEQMALEGAGDRIVCYLHDPVVHNVVQRTKGPSSADYLRYLSRLYGVDLRYEPGMEHWQAHQVATDAGITGIRALLELGVTRFITNSHTAAELMQRDLAAAQTDTTRVDVLFHPVFGAAQVDHPKTSGVLTIGTFGVPEQSKATEVVEEAVRRLATRGRPVRLLVAGYGAQSYASQRGRQDSWVEFFEPSTEAALQSLMQRCDLAIQLRRWNRGESSGVVPTLIGLGIPTIVSSIGAFKEYGNAVQQFEGYDPARLAEIIDSGLRPSAQAMHDYARMHSVETFNERLLDLLGVSDDRITTSPAVLSLRA